MSDHGHDHQHPTGEPAPESATAARLFDVRRIIGGLFVVYGVIVTLAGLTASDADLAKAQGININLWTGLGMLALGLFFLVWLKLRPAVPPTAAELDEGAPAGTSDGSAH
ncbi:hypothetical protein ACFVTP_06270 [Streptomyces celluloflavus]|uniref:hypothetical protein n=1 Tax=Streptomyces celluloflavus TaxID=58344 RepID=UPI0036DC96F6